MERANTTPREKGAPRVEESPPATAHTPAERLAELAAWGVDLSLVRRQLALPPADRVSGLLEAADGLVQRSWWKRLWHPTLHPQPPRRLFEQLRGACEWVLVGRLAESAHGAPFLAHQVEVCFLPTADNVARLVAALAPLRPHLLAGTRRERSPHWFTTEGERLLLAQPALVLETEAALVCLQSELVGVGAYPAVRAASTPLDLYGGAVLVLTLPAELAWRQARSESVDEVAIPQLEAALLLSATAPAPAVPAGER